MQWQEISVTTNEVMEEAVTNLFYEIGAAGVVIEDPKLIERYIQTQNWDDYDLPEVFDADHVVVKGYLPVDEKLPLLLEQFNGALAALSAFFDDYYAKVQLIRVLEEDWANSWKDYYKPQRIGEKIVVVPSWEEYKTEKDDIIITLDPGMAFGTGGHPTTVICIRLLEKYVKPQDKVVDVGTGSGILSIAAAKLGALSVEAIDLDTLAVRMAKLNVKANNVENIVKVSHGNLLDNVEGKHDLIVSNIIANVIIEMSADVYDKLNKSGLFIASGIIDERLDDVLQKLKETGFVITEVIENESWRGIVAAKG
jgi:ribosomal protein L11 methyltransferase